MKDCIFCKIREGEIPKEFTYQDEDVMVFPDIHPRKPVHLLVVPKNHVPELIALSDDKLSKKVWDTVKNMIKKEGLDKRGYRLVAHGGGAQVIDHLHIHVMGPITKEETV